MSLATPARPLQQGIDPASKVVFVHTRSSTGLRSEQRQLLPRAGMEPALLLKPVHDPLAILLPKGAGEWNKPQRRAGLCLAVIARPDVDEVARLTEQVDIRQRQSLSRTGANSRSLEDKEESPSQLRETQEVRTGVEPLHFVLVVALQFLGCRAELSLGQQAWFDAQLA